MKKVIIIGGDKVAYHLIGILEAEHKYDISVVDMQLEVCEKIANSYDVKVFHGDGTNVEVLNRLGAHNADVMIALTGQDENNLVACQIAKLKFNVKYTIAKVNNPRNSYLLKMLGVDRIFSATDMLAQMIDQEVAYSEMSLVYNFEDNTKAIISVPLSPASDAAGKSLMEYNFVNDSRVVLVVRSNGEAEIPTGDLVMENGDTLIMVCDQRDFEQIWLTFVRPELLNSEEYKNKKNK